MRARIHSRTYVRTTRACRVSFACSSARLAKSSDARDLLSSLRLFSRLRHLAAAGNGTSVRFALVAIDKGDDSAGFSAGGALLLLCLLVLREFFKELERKKGRPCLLLESRFRAICTVMKRFSLSRLIRAPPLLLARSLLLSSTRTVEPAFATESARKRNATAPPRSR